MPKRRTGLEYLKLDEQTRKFLERNDKQVQAQKQRQEEKRKQKKKGRHQQPENQLAFDLASYGYEEVLREENGKKNSKSKYKPRDTIGFGSGISTYKDMYGRYGRVKSTWSLLTRREIIGVYAHHAYEATFPAARGNVTAHNQLIDKWADKWGWVPGWWNPYNTPLAPEIDENQIDIFWKETGLDKRHPEYYGHHATD